MENAFNPYYEWLDLKDVETGPNHYRLLGLELYEDDLEELSRGIRVFIEAAEQQIPRLKRRVEVETVNSKALIEERLKKADELAKTDPKAAHKIRTAIVKLYLDVEWAQKYVDRARRALLAANEQKVTEKK